MSAFLIRNGEILAQSDDIDVLSAHVGMLLPGSRKPVRPTEVRTFTYLNGYSSLWVTYSDGAVGKFDCNSMQDLQIWLSGREPKWPEARHYYVSVPLIVFADPEAEQVREPAPGYTPKRVTRARPGPVKRITRTRGAA